MKKDEVLDRLAELQRQIDETEQLVEERNKLIRLAANKYGISHGEIGRISGLSRQGVSYVIQGGK